MMTRIRSLSPAIALAAVAGLAITSPARAGDVTWDNATNNFIWDTSSLNWSGAAWSNAPGDGAIFSAAGIGAVSVDAPITARSVNFSVGGYSLGGVGPLTFTNGGASTLAAGVVSVATGTTATINTPITGSVGIQKFGTGTLELGGANSIAGTVPMAGYVTANVVVGGPNGEAGGTLTLLNGSTLPSTIKVGITNGTLDIGSNNVTLGGLTFRNPSANAVIGTGTLRVNGEIHVLGDLSGTSGNLITPNVDLGGGTQMVRVGVNTFFNPVGACMFMGTLSNGSLFKSYGLQNSGGQGNTDGIGLYGNNTYTGSTTVNGAAIATGTNATTSLTNSGGGIGSGFTIQGANGSLGSATTLRIIGGGGLRLDNNASITNPVFPAAQNNDRIRDDASLQLRDAIFTLVGQTSVAASETFGSLSILGGQNTVTITPTTPASGGTATLTCAGNLSLANRATLTIGAPAAAPLGGANARFFVNGSLPAPDATGLLPRMICNNTADFLTYSGVTGLTPYAGYTTNSFAAGVNIALTAATPTAGSVAINALKTAGTFTTTLTGSDVLTVSSGMVYSTTGTDTFAGGTLAFGATPGVFWGTNVVRATTALTGTQGLVVGSGTLTLAGNLSGLSGMVTVNSGTVNLTTNTFTGPVEVRTGSLSLGVSQTNLGTILLGVPEQDPDLFGTVPNLSFSAAGANATINAQVVVDNGTQSFAGNPLPFGFFASLSPLSNATGSQTLSGNFLLNSPLNLQGGGGSGTGATNFAGTISGPSFFRIPNGRVSFTASSTLSNSGGLFIGNGGFTAIVSLLGTATGNGPITIIGGNNTSLSYAGPGSLSSGPITIQGGATGNTAPRIAPLSTSTISNPINLINNSDVIPVVAGGITATWAGPISGSGTISKTTVTSAGLTDNTGTLIVSNPASTFSGPMTVGAGTLAGSGTLGGAVTVNAGGTLAPGSSIGTMNSGNLSVTGTLATELNFAPLGADLINVTGTVALNSGSILTLSNLGGSPSGTFIIVLNDGADAVNGTFATVNGLPAGATINYAFSGTDSLGRVGDGNDIAVVFSLPCYANCDGSTSAPILNVNDFICFNNLFAAGSPAANCDQSTNPPVLNVNDFSCFMNKYAAGCP